MAWSVCIAFHGKIVETNFELFLPYVVDVVYHVKRQEYILCQMYGNYGILCCVNYDDIMMMKLHAVAGHRNSLPLLFL